MKKINTYNYEIFFLDFFEKNLAQSDKDELFKFLDEHPALKEEFYEFENTTLTTESILNPVKDSLKVENDIEVSIIAYIEKDLNSNEREELTQKIKKSPIYRYEYESYIKTKLPVETIEYQHKESLKRNKRIVPFYLYGIAASVVLLFGLFWIFNDSKSDLHLVSSKQFVSLDIKNNDEMTIVSRKAKIFAAPFIEVEKVEKKSSLEGNNRNTDSQILISELSSKSTSKLMIANATPQISARSDHFLSSLMEQNDKRNVQYLGVIANIGKSIFRKSTKNLLKRNSNLLNMDASEIVIAGYNKLTNKDICINKVKDDSGKLLAFYVCDEDQRLFRYKKK